MRTPARVGSEYVDIEYHQFTQSPAVRTCTRLLGLLTWPVVVPLALLSRLSDVLFHTVSEMVALVPYVVGTIVRYEFYRWTLPHCGINVFIGFGTVFVYRDVSIGDHVSIGKYNVVHHCDFGSYVLTADGCRFLSGSRYHNVDRLDTPMALQGGQVKRIRIADDVWIGANAVLMDDVAGGSVVGAGSVVTAPVDARTIVAGNPARLIRKRE